MKKTQLPNLIQVMQLPDPKMEEYVPADALTISIEKLKTDSPLIKPLFDLVNSASKGGSGFYYVKTNGLNLFSAKDGSGFIGALKNANNQVAGQARLFQVPLDPAGLALSLSLLAVNQKMDTIIEKQKEILSYMEIQERSGIQSDLNCLNDIAKNYSYNATNNSYLSLNAGQVPSIKREADKSLNTYEARLKQACDKNGGLHFDGGVEQKIQQFVTLLNDYQRALYVYSFSSLLNCFLSKSFDHNSLQDIVDNIQSRQLTYETTLSLAQSKIASESKKSIQSSLKRGLSFAYSVAGTPLFPKKEPKFIENAQMKSKNKSKEISSGVDAKAEEKAAILSKTRKDLVKPFLDGFAYLDSAYNGSVSIMFDQKKVCLSFSQPDKKKK